MKKLMMILAVAIASIAMTGCAEKKTFKRSDGTEFTAKPFGWMDKDKEIEGVDYELCTGNIVLSVLFGETVVAPVEEPATESKKDVELKNLKELTLEKHYEKYEQKSICCDNCYRNDFFRYLLHIV